MLKAIMDSVQQDESPTGEKSMFLTDDDKSRFIKLPVTFLYNEIPNLKLNITDFRVYADLKFHSNWDTGVTHFFTRKQLAKRLGLSTRTVRNTLNKLEKVKLIKLLKNVELQYQIIDQPVFEAQVKERTEQRKERERVDQVEQEKQLLEFNRSERHLRHARQKQYYDEFEMFPTAKIIENLGEMSDEEFDKWIEHRRNLSEEDREKLGDTRPDGSPYSPS